jgi:hypothetical protein
MELWKFRTADIIIAKNFDPQIRKYLPVANIHNHLCYEYFINDDKIKIRRHFERFNYGK